MQIDGMNELNAQLRALETLATGRSGAAAPAERTGGIDFAAALKVALERVNESQQSALGLARQYETGRGDVPLHEVMLSMQKANIAFQGAVQVRNRLVAAYNDIMNMQI